MDKLVLSDNPNYFDEEAANRRCEPNSRSFFLFKKRNSSSKVTTSKSNTKVSEDVPDSKCDERVKGIPRSRSKSTSTAVKPTGTRKKQFITDHQNCIIAGSPESMDSITENSENNDVFYSNFTKDSRNSHRENIDDKSSQEYGGEQRRHSIGTFMGKEHSRTDSVSDEVPKMQAPKAPTNVAGKGSSAMDDILFVSVRHNEMVTVWVNHLKTCFDKITKQRGRLPFNFLHLKIDEDQITTDLIQRCHSTKLQIVIVCPILLSLSAQFLLSSLGSILKPERVLGMLLDVTETRVWEIHKSTFPAFSKWRTCVVGDHEQSFVSELLGIATDILGRALRQQPLSDAITTSKIVSTASSHTQHDAFTLFPRKVKVGQNKIIAILVEPLMKDDWMKIKIEKSSEIIEITNIKRRNPYTIQFSIPECCMEVSMMINVRLEKNDVDLGCRPLKCESRLRELEQILKAQDAPMEFLCQSLGIASADRDKLDTYLLQSFQKNMPPNFHLLNYEDAINPKTRREANPEEYPTMMHFAANWGLERLCVQLMDCPGGDVACEIRNISGRTPADLAEIGGHFSLANSFKNFMQMHEFTTMYHYFKGISEASNKIVIEPKSSSNSRTKRDTEVNVTMPSSRIDGTLRRHHQIEGYMEMNATGNNIEPSQNDSSNTVSNLNYLNLDCSEGQEEFIMDQAKFARKNEEITNNLNFKQDSREMQNNMLSNELKFTELEYFESNDINKSDAFSQECSNVLENCNIVDNNDFDYMVQPSNVPVRTFETGGDYLIQPSNIPIFHGHTKLDSTAGHQSLQFKKQTNVEDNEEKEISHIRVSFHKKDRESESKTKTSTLKRQKSNTSEKSVDDELLEIITDFKNNVFTIQEVEQLVASWKSRNDVQKSFREKQMQLQTMREEYDRIQQQMNDKLKRPSPFERMRKMFSRNRSLSDKKNDSCATESSDLCDDIKFSMLVPTSQSHRPISSGSLQSVSSGSSGRISTFSGTSIGDSGTHSDSEDRKFGLINSINEKERCQNDVMENYMIPPAPRPVDENIRPCTSSMNADEHYTIFPSNLPVLQGNSNDFIKTSSVLKPIDEAKETDALIQHITVQLPVQSNSYTELNFDWFSTTSFKSNVEKSSTKNNDNKTLDG
ncbi:uncharacterized protein LOC129775809 isoform X2 [Toxorhynchites rutilus septentrionalis]|uniref:uncharacterized protein LOC129775809 isoform X2 n=1 Tax=Toxorhynchites rutilus septentrionalis TaxID=329112 RepID=UPI00247A4C86|nr:uncharacterized protein LOC129775809 isoform X2 [Toxorhynchites rutilus septentrionalis]